MQDERFAWQFFHDGDDDLAVAVGRDEGEHDSNDEGYDDDVSCGGGDTVSYGGGDSDGYDDY